MALLLNIVTIFVLIIAGAFSLFLRRKTGGHWCWFLVSAALFLMAFRYCLLQFDGFSAGYDTPHALILGILQFVKALVLVAGLIALGSVMAEMSRARALHRTSEERLRHELEINQFHHDNSPLAIIEWSQDSRVLKWSRGAERIFGWQAHEVDGMAPTDWEFIYPDDQPEVERGIRRLVTGVELRNSMQHRNYTKSGEIIHCDWHNSVLLDNCGQVQSVLSHVMDVTARVEAEEQLKQATYELERRVLERTAQLEREVAERRKKEEALKLSERRFSAIFNQTLQMTAIVSTDGTLLEVNQTILDIKGVRRDEVIQRPLWEAFWSDLEESRHQRMRLGVAHASKGNLVRYEEDFLTRDQGMRVIDFSLKPVRNESGEVVWLIAEARDITDSKLQEDALVESEERFRAALESAPIGMAILDLTGNWIKVNKALCEILGYNEEELLSTDYQSITHKDDLPADLEFIEQLMSGQINHYKLEKRYLHKNGTPVWVMLHCCVVRDTQHNKPLYFLAEVEDITERRQNAQKLEQANQKLAQTVAGLEKANHQMMLLKDMSDQLQACLDLPEAGQVVSVFSARLFSGCSGAVYLFNSSRNSIEMISKWGAAESVRSFRPEDCWALRRGRIHVSENPGGVICRHLQQSGQPGNTLCVPLVAQGESMGILEIHFEVDCCAHDESALRQLGANVAEHVALVFANLKLREILHAQSMRDELTGMYNRRYMEESFEREISRAMRNDRPLSVVMLDIDHFKRFNDTHGHDAGDAVLKALGDKLRSSLRTEDIVCRYGGEEFMLIMPDAPLVAALERAEQLRREIEEIEVQFREKPLEQITVSMGVSAFPDHGNDPGVLKRAADLALYRSKVDGRNRVTPATRGAVEMPVR